MNVSDLPHLNAALNATCAVLLVLGYRLIRAGRRAAHQRVMLSALACSAVFLTSYLYYHAHVGSIHFRGEGWLRWTYLTILFTHTVLAIVIVPLAGVTVWRARKGDFARHRRIARITLPLWLYVSVTGVVVYWMLYQMKI
jgi:uncharacterized membrane protein YozB (DUF420 family)